MTIASDILARGPILYWKLDDASGPAASDSSGNGRAGAYGGPFTLGQYGPEPNTRAVQLAAGGIVQRQGVVQLITAPWSWVWYMSINAVATPSNTATVINGAPSFNRGWFTRYNSDNTIQIGYYRSDGVQTTSAAATMPVWNKWWHAHAVVFNGAGAMSYYLDGTLVCSQASQGLSSSVQGGDFLTVGANYGAVYAHFAYFDKALTQADVTAISGYRYDWPFGPMVNAVYPPGPGASGSNLNPSDPIVIANQQDLSDIRSAVIRTYPPVP